MPSINIHDHYGGNIQNRLIIREIVNAAYKHLKLKTKIVLSVILVSDDEIRELNRTYRMVDSATDVLSFPTDGPDNEIGDIFISLDKVRMQALEYNHSEERELAFLTLHGFLHCLGYDHGNIEDEERMFSLQKEIIESTRFKKE
ncbi:MAG: rRNA maturation RNase YbeY [Acholeplasmataceae bacterium]|nr:rRNA maturation RNase YbeY [Acholeplasmataceae bacterium]